MLKRIKEFIFGSKQTVDCPVCGGTMTEQKSLRPDPYWDINMRCENCGAITDGRVIYTDVPREQWYDG